MQQLQGSYRGDQSEMLSQIMGGDYDPQTALSAMAQQMLSAGMSSSTALKTAAMKEDAASNRDLLTRQYQMIAEKRARKNTLQDEARKRAQMLEDYERIKKDKAAESALSRAQAVEDRNFQRQSTLWDFLNKEESIKGAEKRKAREDASSTAAKAAGMRKGLGLVLKQFHDALDPNDPIMARERSALAGSIATLDTILNGVKDPNEQAAIIASVANVFAPSAQGKLSDIANRSVMNRTATPQQPSSRPPQQPAQQSSPGPVTTANTGMPYDQSSGGTGAVNWLLRTSD